MYWSSLWKKQFVKHFDNKLQAYAIEAVGKAEAERMRMKAAAYKQYGDAAILSLTLEALPKVWLFALIITFRFNLNLKYILTQIFKSIK